MDTRAAKGPESESEGNVGRRPVADGPTLPYAKAFVVQFTAETDPHLDHVAGRVEHLQTGRQSRFASIDALLACITALLGDSATTSAERAPSTTKRGQRPRTAPGARDRPGSP
jgi:hypothetical protein